MASYLSPTAAHREKLRAGQPQMAQQQQQQQQPRQQPPPASHPQPVFLGYLDESITAAYQAEVNDRVSKIGGKADWPVRKADAAHSPPRPPPSLNDLRCDLCGSPSLLVSQIYAPLEQSPFHRTLYVFACLAPKCWNKSESWKCFRLQTRESSSVVADTTTTTSSATSGATPKKTEWFDGADDWDDDDDETDDDDKPMDQEEEEVEDNGNYLDNAAAVKAPITQDPQQQRHLLAMESLSLSDDKPTGYSPVISPSSSSSSACSSMAEGARGCDPNANRPPSASDEGAAAAPSANPRAAGGGGPGGHAHRGCQMEAEIEADQDGTDVIALETPPEKFSNSCIPQLFGEANHAAPCNLNLEFVPYFINVDEESSSSSSVHTPSLSKEERQLLLEYQVGEHEQKSQASDGKRGGQTGQTGPGRDTDGYEKAEPRHGDVWFYKFMRVMQENPGHILRYSRDPRHAPLFPSQPPAPGQLPVQCSHCHAHLLPELQLMPSLLSFLKLAGSAADSAAGPLEFGTVVVYACANSCWNEAADGFRTERVWVQAESV